MTFTCDRAPRFIGLLSTTSAHTTRTLPARVLHLPTSLALVTTGTLTLVPHETVDTRGVTLARRRGAMIHYQVTTIRAGVVVRTRAAVVIRRVMVGTQLSHRARISG